MRGRLNMVVIRRLLSHHVSLSYYRHAVKAITVQLEVLMKPGIYEKKLYRAGRGRIARASFASFLSTVSRRHEYHSKCRSAAEKQVYTMRLFTG